MTEYVKGGEPAECPYDKRVFVIDEGELSFRDE
jgi:hypothetical protein